MRDAVIMALRAPANSVPRRLRHCGLGGPRLLADHLKHISPLEVGRKDRPAPCELVAREVVAGNDRGFVREWRDRHGLWRLAGARSVRQSAYCSLQESARPDRAVA